MISFFSYMRFTTHTKFTLAYTVRGIYSSLSLNDSQIILPRFIENVYLCPNQWCHIYHALIFHLYLSLFLDFLTYWTGLSAQLCAKNLLLGRICSHSSFSGILSHSSMLIFHRTSVILHLKKIKLAFVLNTHHLLNGLNYYLYSVELSYLPFCLLVCFLIERKGWIYRVWFSNFA